MRLVLNVLWLVLSGFWMFLAYLLAGLLLMITIIGIPFGVAAFRIGFYALWPFGRRIVKKPSAGLGSVLGNVLWFVLAGWWLALAHVVTGVLLCLTIIGIPLGLANFKLIPVSCGRWARTSSASRARTRSCPRRRSSRAERRLVQEMSVPAAGAPAGRRRRGRRRAGGLG